MDHIWQDFLTIIRDEMGSRVVDTWFKAVSLHRWDMLTSTAYLQTPNAFVRDWICKNYLSLCQTHLARLLHVAEIKIIIVQASVATADVEQSSASNVNSNNGIGSRVTSSVKDSDKRDSRESNFSVFGADTSKAIIPATTQHKAQEKAQNSTVFGQASQQNSAQHYSQKSYSQKNNTQNAHYAPQNSSAQQYQQNKSRISPQAWQNLGYQHEAPTARTQSAQVQAQNQSRVQNQQIVPVISNSHAPAQVHAQAQSEVALYKPAKVASIKRGNYTNNNYSFDNFVVAQSNSLAYAAAHAVTEKPGQLYNPLFIYGKSGLGKTHLLHAIGGAIKQRNQKAVVLYQTTDRFVSEFINAIRFNKVHQFETKYQGADVLLIDDVQFISHKGQTQEAFFHIFNLLYDAHKQIVFSSDTFPQDMDGIAERLRSRFAWGLVTDIYEPSLETKVAILKKKAESSNEIVGDDALYFIAEQVTSNIRELEGALVRVIAFASLTQQAITLELAQRVLDRGVPVKKEKVVDFEAIIKVVNKNYHCTMTELCSKSRNKHIAFIRHIAMYFMKQLTEKSLRDIGHFLGGRDHTTVVHALDKIERHIQENPSFGLELKRIESELRN